MLDVNVSVSLSPSGVWLDRICSVSKNSVTSRSAAYASIAASTSASPCNDVCSRERGVVVRRENGIGSNNDERAESDQFMNEGVERA